MQFKSAKMGGNARPVKARVAALAGGFAMGMLAFSPLLAMEPGTALVQADQPGTAKRAELTGVDIATAPDLRERERAINEVIRKAFKEKNPQGVWQTLAGKKLVEIAPRTLALAALSKNLSIHSAHLNKDIAAAALLEAKALFDPLVNVTFNYSSQRDYQRKEQVIKYHKATVSTTALSANGVPVFDANGQCTATLVALGVYGHCSTATGAATERGQPANLIFFDQGPVYYIGFDQPRPAGYKTVTETAHQRAEGTSQVDETYKADFSMTQQLPWGLGFSLNYETTFHQANFSVFSGAPNVLVGSYHRPWTSSVSAGVLAPLPGTKNYGPEAAATDVTNKLAMLNDEKAVWDVKAVINATLLNVDLAYWNLVSSANNLYAAIQNETGVQKLMEKTDRMFELREVTDYSKTQVQAELERVKGEVELARNDYIRASNALQPLLDGGHDTVYLPIGYTVPLSQSLELDPTQIRRDLVKMNPQLQSQEYNVKSAAVLERQAQLQLRPDFSFTAGVSAAEIGSTFGYHDWWQSATRVVDPDIVSQSYALSFTRPWGNRLANSRYQETQYNRHAQELGMRATENSLSRALADAAVSVISARARTAITGRSLGLAQTAYDKAVAQQQSRGVTEYEIIQQSNNLLAATRDWIASVIDAKQAEARWFAARGDIAAKYAEWTAQTITDSARVKALASDQVVPLFAPEKKDVH